MNEENKNIIDNNANTENINVQGTSTESNISPKIESTVIETPKAESSKDDVNKIKIRTILAQRFKKSKPGFKKAIPLILVALISFAAGFGVDRVLLRHRLDNNFKDSPKLQQKFDGFSFKDRKNINPNRKGSFNKGNSNSKSN